MRVFGTLAFLAIASVELVVAQSGGGVPAAASSAGPQATSCGNPTGAGRGGGGAAADAGRDAQPIFPPGQYPVQLPAKSLLGAPNDLPNPFAAGVDWGQLPAGRKWGSTASVY